MSAGGRWRTDCSTDDSPVDGEFALVDVLGWNEELFTVYPAFGLELVNVCEVMG